MKALKWPVNVEMSESAFDRQLALDHLLWKRLKEITNVHKKQRDAPCRLIRNVKTTHIAMLHM